MRPNWVDWLSASVAGVFDIETRTFSPGAQAGNGALSLLTDRRGALLAMRDGSLRLAHRWTEALLEKGASLRIPGASGLRVADAALRLNVITRAWPGRESYMYRVDAASRANPAGLRFLRELPVTPADIAADDRPVALIIHGFGSTTGGSYFEPLKYWLTDPETQRYGLVLGFECDTLQRRIPDLADDLRRQLERLGLLQGRRRIDLYTHSMGAIIARWLLENPEAPESAGQQAVRTSVRRLIMAGPPNRGARLAELGDQLMQLLQRAGKVPEQERGTTAMALRLPLISALTRRLAARVPAVRLLNDVLTDLEPGSQFLGALRGGPGACDDLPEYILIQGVYDPVPAGEPVSLRLLRQAGTLLGDCDPRWSDLVVSVQSQAGFEPSLRGVKQLILRQTWHHQYWLDPATFERIRCGVLDRFG